MRVSGCDILWAFEQLINIRSDLDIEMNSEDGISISRSVLYTIYIYLFICG
jgi:hypothetical protein